MSHDLRPHRTLRTAFDGTGPSAWRLVAAVVLALVLLVPDTGAHGQPVPGPDYGDYWSWGGITDQLETYQRQHPGLVRVESIGRSHEGRDILAVKIAADVKTDHEDRPEVLFLSGIHPREQPPQVAVMEFLDELVSGYGRDERITRLLETRQIWMIPVFNVDGKVYDFTNGDGTRGANWRVSRRPFGEGRFGVDLNRNGVVGWGSASNSPGSATYHGPGPASEPETRALFDFMAERRFRVFLDIHSSLEAYLVPGHLIREESDRYRRLVEGMRERQEDPYSGAPRSEETESRSTAGTGAGQTHVTGFYIHGAYSVIFEVGPSGRPARFYPTRDEILDHYRRNVREPWFYALEVAGDLPVRRPGRARSQGYDLSGEPVPGARLELTPRIEGNAAYAVLVSRDPAVRVTGEYRLLPLRRGGHVLNVSSSARPGEEVVLQLYLWDRERGRSVVDLSILVAEPRKVETR